MGSFILFGETCCLYSVVRRQNYHKIYIMLCQKQLYDVQSECAVWRFGEEEYIYALLNCVGLWTNTLRRACRA